MKIAITATAPNLDADIDPRFGRCQYFVIVDTDTMKVEALQNSSVAAGGGAGIASAQMISEKGIEAILTGNCGPNAFSVLEAAGLKVITSVSGKVRDAIEAYKSGKYQASVQANAAPHSGMERE